VNHEVHLKRSSPVQERKSRRVKNSHRGVDVVKDCSAYAWYSNKSGFIPRNSRIDDTEKNIMVFLQIQMVMATRYHIVV
jgi:hypothetical protein